MTDTLRLIQPDDWHVHLRDGEMLVLTVGDTARQFRRAIVMPNLLPPITTTEQARQYRQRILAVVPKRVEFEPLMTLYLTDTTTTEEIYRAKDSGFVHAVKYYPAMATTNSAAGVSDIWRLDDVLAVMAEVTLPLLVHGEAVDPQVDVFEREQVFIQQTLQPLLQRHPRLKVVFEHITTAEAAAFVRSAGSRVAATITAHHLLLNRNALFSGGLRPHHYCLPLPKREAHRQALVATATSGEPCFFLGTDSAPHPRARKESACGCAGIYTARTAMALYAEVFEAANALPRLEAFASRNGAAFYNLELNSGTLCLERRTTQVPTVLHAGKDVVVPFRGGTTLNWTVTPQ